MVVRKKKQEAAAPAPVPPAVTPVEPPAAPEQAEPAPKQRSGLHMQRKLTPETCAFFDWDPNSEHSRVDITKAVNEYIRKNGLQKNPNDLRNIFPDGPLMKLLRLTTDEPLMFKDVQKHYVHLFADQQPPPATDSTKRVRKSKAAAATAQ